MIAILAKEIVNEWSLLGTNNKIINVIWLEKLKREITHRRVIIRSNRGINSIQDI